MNIMFAAYSLVTFACCCHTNERIMNQFNLIDFDYKYGVRHYTQVS